MKSCVCSLPPSACKNCSVYKENMKELNQWIPNGTYPWSPTTPYYPYLPETHKVKKITRTIEKYDKHGNYKGKEIIIEEEEIYDDHPPYIPYVPYPPSGDPVWITCDDNNWVINVDNDDSNSITISDPNITYYYTTNNSDTSYIDSPKDFTNCCIN